MIEWFKKASLIQQIIAMTVFLIVAGIVIGLVFKILSIIFPVLVLAGIIVVGLRIFGNMRGK